MRKKSIFAKIMTGALLLSTLVSGCGKSSEPDDIAVNDGYESLNETVEQSDSRKNGISKEDIKVGVIYITDPAEGSGYSYTHDLGIEGMRENLMLSEEQIVKKIVDDTDQVGTRKAIQECKLV